MERKSYPINVSGPFWTLFLTSRLTTKFVGGSSCFCLTDPDSRSQTILVVPAGKYSTVPSTEEVLRHFPVAEVGRKLYESATELPMDFATLRRVQQVHCEDVRTRRRRVRVLTLGHTASDKGKEVHTLAFMNFWRAPLLQIERIRLAVGSEQIWFMSQLTLESRVLIHLMPGEEFGFRGETLEFNFEGVTHLVHVPNEGRSA